MKRLLAVALLVVATGCSTNLPIDASGPEIYDALCARCHADDLSGGVGPALGAGSPLSQQPDSYVIQTITAGLGRMPAFRSTLTEDQIILVTDYLREQQGIR